MPSGHFLQGEHHVCCYITAKERTGQTTPLVQHNTIALLTCHCFFGCSSVHGFSLLLPDDFLRMPCMSASVTMRGIA